MESHAAIPVLLHLVLTHEARIADHVGGQDRRQSSLNAYGHEVSLAEAKEDRNSSLTSANQRARMSQKWLQSEVQ